MGRKLGGLCLFSWGAMSPSNTMWPGPRPTSIASGILTHPAVWPQQTWADKKPRKGADGHRRQRARLVAAYLVPAVTVTSF